MIMTSHLTFLIMLKQIYHLKALDANQFDANQVDHSLDVLSNVITFGILNEKTLYQNVSSVRPENFKSDKGVQEVSKTSNDENRDEDDPTSVADMSNDNIPISKLNKKKTKIAKGVCASSLKPSHFSEKSDSYWNNISGAWRVSQHISAHKPEVDDMLHLLQGSHSDLEHGPDAGADVDD
ncbi:unnamed protein product [Citrullus colocynthis]|uniref:Uncharacterized protein n=1 Tax=Citrullus colocynthis TaxID=252529 RepID=A0ABP0Y908_9ROSI